MKPKRILHCILLTALLVATGCSLASCKEDTDAPAPTATPNPSVSVSPSPMATPAPQSRPHVEGVALPQTEEVSLNGTWKFYKDTKTAVRTFSAETNAEIKANGSATVRLQITKPEEMLYSKATLTLKLHKDAPLRAAVGSSLSLSLVLNEKQTFFTPLSEEKMDAVTDDTYTVDISMCYTALIEGENTFQLSTTAASGSVSVEKLTVTAYPTLMFDAGTIQVPGAWELQLSDTEAYTAYDGVGWYEHSFDYPHTQADSNTRLLTFSGIDYYAEIWINDVFILSHENGYTPITIDLSDYASFLTETDNRLTVRVTDQSTAADAAFPLKQTLAGFYHDTVGVNYGGIWGDVYLTDVPKKRAENLLVTADSETGLVTIDADISGTNLSDKDETVLFAVCDADGTVLGETSVPLRRDGSAALSVTVDIGDAARAWSADTPVLYSARVTVGGYTTAATFGFAKVEKESDSILLNAMPIQLNGVLFWLGNWEQLTPRYDPEAFRVQIQQLKAYGFNAIKFCLVVPPEYLLDICDSEGIYVYIEYPMWNPVQTDAFFTRCYTQIPDMVRLARNHPCVICSDFNCEMGAFSDEMATLMRWCVETGRELDPNRLFADNSTTGQQGIGYNDFWTWHPYTDALNFADYAKSIVKLRTANGTLPLVFGEYADYPALSDFSKFVGADGSTPWNWTVCDDPFRADLYYAKKGYSAEAIQALVTASEENCVEMKMHIVQETKKTKGLAAYFLTIMQDIGHSVAGFFDETGEVKYTADQTQFVRETVLLMDKTVYNFAGGTTAKLTPAISHFGSDDLTDGTLAFTLTSGAQTLASGTLLRNVTAPNGTYTAFSAVELAIPAVSCLTECTLTLSLTGEGYAYTNNWQVTLYPNDFITAEALQGKTVAVSGAKADFFERYPFAVKWKNGDKPDVLVAFGSLSGEQLSYLKNGGKVIYIGTGSEAVEVSKGTYYSQYVLLNFPQADHEIVSELAEKGYGGTRFLTLQTQYVITEDADTPLTHSLIGKVLLRDNVPDAVASGSYLSEFTVGDGTLIQCTLNFTDGDAPLCNYLTDRMLSYIANK